MVETEYNSIIAAELEANATVDINGPPEGGAWSVEIGEQGGEEDPKGRVKSSASTSLDYEDTSSSSD